MLSEVAGFEALADLGHGTVLDLTGAFLGDADDLADLLKGQGLTVGADDRGGGFVGDARDTDMGGGGVGASSRLIFLSSTLF